MIKMLTLLKEIENATKLNGRKELNKEKRKKNMLSRHALLCAVKIWVKKYTRRPWRCCWAGVGAAVVWMGQEVAAFRFHTNSLRHGRQAK